MDVYRLLAALDELWKDRAGVLHEWQMALRERERAAERRERHVIAREHALRRASGGLTARQRAWAQERGTRPVSGARRRAQRHVLVTWLYHRRRADDVAAEWATVLDADEVAVEQARRDLAQATCRLLEAWGNDVPAATGRTVRQLRSLARRPSPSA